MSSLTGKEELGPVSDEARQLLGEALPVRGRDREVLREVLDLSEQDVNALAEEAAI